MENYLFLPGMPIQVGDAVSPLKLTIVIVPITVGFGRSLVHPEHVEQAALHQVVRLGGPYDVAGAECVAAVVALAIFRALVADSHATRANRGRRLVGQASLGRRGTPVDEQNV